MLIWLSFVIVISRWAKKRFNAGAEAHLVEYLVVGLRLWRKNTFTIAVVGIFLLLVWIIQPHQFSLLVILILLLTWLGTKVLINWSGLLLTSNVIQYGIKQHRAIRRTIIILSVLSVITALIHLEDESQAALSLTARDLVDSLFMILLSLAVPTLMRGRKLVLTAMRGRIEGYWLLVTNLMSLLLPGAIVTVSVLGVIGYISLGWMIAKYLSLFLLVLIGWIITYGLMNDLTNLWKSLVLKNSPYGSLFAEDLIPLAHKLLQLTLLGFAVIAFLWLTGWYSDIAMKEGFGKVLHFQLVAFENGNNITVLDVLLSVLIIWTVFWLGGWSRRVSYRWVLFNISDTGVRHSLSVFIQYSIILIGLLIALKTIGIDPTALTVFAGAVGVGLGFGLQNVANNFISGILLLIERPLRVGDFVEIESPTGTKVMYNGTVTHIGIRSLMLATQDNKKIIVPNSSVISSPFKNSTAASHSDESQIADTVLTIGISYDSDPHVVEFLLKELLENTPEILKEPTPQIYLSEFSDSKINFQFKYFVDTKTANVLAVKSKVLFNIWDRFKASDIKMSYL
ncbi:MscS Mechanosensitive ion channel [Beggiatoa sp. PS]|nr:MscS Mechanosensitive ion channel [Beggiatoa sp. PS]